MSVVRAIVRVSSVVCVVSGDGGLVASGGGGRPCGRLVWVDVDQGRVCPVVLTRPCFRRFPGRRRVERGTSRPGGRPGPCSRSTGPLTSKVPRSRVCLKSLSLVGSLRSGRTPSLLRTCRRFGLVGREVEGGTGVVSVGFLLTDGVRGWGQG